jgi:hypothetical protein
MACDQPAQLRDFASESRVEAKSLIAALDEIVTAAKEPDLAARARRLPVALKRGRATLGRHEAKMRSGGFARAPTAEQHGIAHERTLEIRELLAKVVQSWPRKDTPRDDVAVWAISARADLAAVVAATNQINLEDDVRDALRCVAVGKSLDFNVAFADLIPDAVERHRLLVQLANDACVGAAVDIANGRVYKLSPTRRRRVLTYLSPLFFLVLTAALVSALGQAFKDQLHIGHWYAILGSYGLVVGGVVAHLVVENLKQAQLGKVQILALNDFLNWLNLHWLGLAATFFPIVVTVLGLRAAGIAQNGTQSTLLWLSAGYSVDSVAGTILSRFDGSSGAFEQLTRLLKPTTPPPAAAAAAAPTD